MAPAENKQIRITMCYVWSHIYENFLVLEKDADAERTIDMVKKINVN